MIKGQISNLLRALGLSHAADKLRFYFNQRKNKTANRIFQKDHPNVKLPPDYLMYESFQVNYKKYIEQGIDSAEYIKSIVDPHLKMQGIKLLDWGCGPGRVVRHWPDILDAKSEIHGTDYNKKSIAWNSANLPRIHFNHNSLEAKLPYESDYFDVIYGWSIFTHLSEKMHKTWFQELVRCTKPGGVLFLTTQGDNFKIKLSALEKRQYEQGELVVRGKVKEGHRTYSAFHPTAFMKSLFADHEVLEFIVTEPESGKWLPQDVWLVRKS